MNHKTRSNAHNKGLKVESPRRTLDNDIKDEVQNSDGAIDDKDIGVTLRIRPLDVNTKLQVYYNEPEEIDRGYFIHSDGLARQRKPDMHERKHYGDVPIPSCRLVESSQNNGTWKRPNRYVKYKHSSSIIKNGSIEYDVDSDDEDFIENINENYPENSKKRLTDTDFEKYIDYFEKEYASEENEEQLPLIKLIQRFKENRCTICSDFINIEENDDNEGIKCQNCGIFVHLRCYGNVDTELWKCDRCLYKPSNNVQCHCCGGTKGFQTKDNDGLWSHVSCLKLLPTGPKSRPSRKSKTFTQIKECCLCHKNIGYCLKCSENSCNKTFHPRCANIFGLYVEQKKSKSRYYCRKHTPLNSIENILMRISLSTSEFENIKKVISKSKSLKHVDDYTLKLLYIYWILKRKVYGRELIFRLYLLSESSRRQKEQKETLNKMEMKMSNLLQLRQHLERIRLLAHLCKKRETTKRQYTLLLSNLFDAYEHHKNEKQNNLSQSLPNENQRRKLRALESNIGGKVYTLK